MRQLLSYLIIALALVAATAARAENETDRLREALRSVTAQLRSLEDARAVQQAKLTAAEQERDRLRKQNEAFRAQVKEAEQAYRQAVRDSTTGWPSATTRWRNGRAPMARRQPSPAPRTPSAPNSRARRPH